MPFDVSLPELLIILVAALLVFGPKRLPEMGRSLGKGLREFRNSVSGITDVGPEAPEAPAAHEAGVLGPTSPFPSAREDPDPAEVKAALASLSDEDRRAVIASLSSDVQQDEHRVVSP